MVTRRIDATLSALLHPALGACTDDSTAPLATSADIPVYETFAAAAAAADTVVAATVTDDARTIADNGGDEADPGVELIATIIEVHGYLVGDGLSEWRSITMSVTPSMVAVRPSSIAGRGATTSVDGESTIRSTTTGSPGPSGQRNAGPKGLPGMAGDDGSTSSRPYRMGKRAEQVEETRRRIVQATVELHTTVGPANATVSAIAERAGVTRLTVYRHFPEQDTLFQACMGLWSERHPWPDPEAWREIADPQDRARRGLVELYVWYGEHAQDLLPIYRDLPVAPRSTQEAVVEIDRAMAEALIADWEVSGRARRRLRAAAGHVVRLWTWHSLAKEQELGDQTAGELAASLLHVAAVREPVGRLDTGRET